MLTFWDWKDHEVYDFKQASKNSLKEQKYILNGHSLNEIVQLK